MRGIKVRTFGDMFRGMDDMLRFNPNSDSSFDIDAQNEGDNIVIRADLPGVCKDDISVTLEDNVLTISGNKKDHSEEIESTVYLQERTFGSFCRSLRVPPDISEDIHATMKNGVLQLILKRNESPKPREIKIS
jgi:HSP20 family protein